MTTSFSVANESDLNTAIRDIDAGGTQGASNTAYTITISPDANMVLSSQLLAINLDSGSSLTIIGNSNTLNGQGSQRGLFVYAGSVTVENLTIENMKAVGGAGGGGFEAGGGGGGGAGLGGGLFVASGGTVTLENVEFAGNTAVGGKGGGPGPGGSVGFGGGGGGLGGAGGNAGGGGGGVGASASGAVGGNGFPGSPGIIPGAAAGGTVTGLSASHGAGGASGGGGGSAVVFEGGAFYGGGGGVAGGNSAGGFGGGGGAGYVGAQGLAPHLTFFAGAGGAGGFGGGGGGGSGGGSSGTGGPANATGGAGGFGGAGGGGGPPGAGVGTPKPGASGFGAGTSTYGGGGGLGAGGDIFVQQGGNLTIDNGSLSGGTAQGGAGSGNAGSGLGLGGGIFLQGNETLNLSAASGQVLTISDVIADQTGSGGTGNNAGTGILHVVGGGTVVFSAANTYSGFTNLIGTTLSIAADDNIGQDSGAVVLEGSGGTLLMTASFTLAHPVLVLADGSLDVTAGQTVTLTGGIGRSGPAPASLEVTGPGKLVLDSSNDLLNNGINLHAGTLVLDTAGAAGFGPISFLASATLVIEPGAVPTNPIDNFTLGDTIDLAGIGTATGAALGANDVLTVTESGGSTIQLQLGNVTLGVVYAVSPDGNDGTLIELVPNPPPPAGTTADMIMNNPTNGDYEIYNIGGNQILAAYSLGQVGSPWTFVGMGTFQAGDVDDMLLRNSSTGQFEAYYISDNKITNAALIGTVGTNWNFAGTGDFDGQSSLTELLLRNGSSGAFELYQVAGAGVLSGSSVAAVGNNFSVKGFGNFSGSSVTQMMMQDTTEDASAGQLELYTYQPSTASFAGIDVGKVGSNLSFVGAADLLGNGETQMVMQQNNGNFWLYTYSAATSSLSGTLVGAIGSNFHVVGFGPLGMVGQDEMLMQDAAGDFEVYQYNASLNAFVGTSMGTVGAPWVVDGIAANAGGSAASGASTAQLVQAIASSGVSASVSIVSSPTIGAEPSQQALLTTPHA